MKFSFSKVECFKNCPYHFKLRYLDRLTTYKDYTDPANPLVIGTAMHHGIENNVAEAVKEYLNYYPIVTDEHYNEVIKLENLIPKVKALMLNLPEDVTFEYELRDGDNFLGYIDLLIHNVQDDTYSIYDFKYSNNVDHYLESAQIHLYKYMFEKLTGNKVKHIGYIFIPKISIRQKKTEDLYQFRVRLQEELDKAQPFVKKVEYNCKKVVDFFSIIDDISNCKNFPKNTNKLCAWCEFRGFCEDNNNDLDIDSEETPFDSYKEYLGKGDLK